MTSAKNLGTRSLHRIFALILAAILLVIAEFVFRLVFPLPEISNFNRIDYSQLVGSSQATALRYLSNSSFTYTSEPDHFSFVHSLNLYGFRDGSWRLGRGPAKERILMIGDSFVEGFGTSDNETIPRTFERRALERGMRVEVLNFGVGAAAIPQYFALVRDALPQFRADDLFLIFYMNDLPPPDYEPDWLEDPLKPVFSASLAPRAYVVVKKLFRGEPVPRAWTAPPFPFFAPVPNPENPWSLKGYRERAAEFVSPEIAGAMSRGMFNPFIVDQYSRQEARLKRSFDVVAHLSALKEFTRRFSSRLYVVYIPSKNQVSDFYLPYLREFSKNKEPTSLMGEAYRVQAKILEATCAELGIPFYDLTAFLEREEESGRHLYWSYDGHMNAQGYSEVGAALFDWWRRSGQGAGASDP